MCKYTKYTNLDFCIDWGFLPLRSLIIEWILANPHFQHIAFHFCTF